MIDIDRPDERAEEREYDPPSVEDLDAPEGPAVTAGGVPISPVKAAPREL